MKIIGIIAEYNPFHNGHLYHMEKARELTGADGIVVLMSGNFVQRGEPAVIDKVRRTEAVLECGADAVLELPVSWAAGTAERFASGAVSVMNRLNIISGIACGVETSDARIADSILRFSGKDTYSSDEFNAQIHRRMDLGMTWPAARAAVLEEYIPGAGAYLSGPNNILSFEYRRAMSQIPGCHLTLYEIPRAGSGYHDPLLSESSGISSATAIRRAMLEGRTYAPDGTHTLPEEFLHHISDFMPDSMAERLAYAIGPDDLSPYLFYSVMTSSGDQLALIQDMNRDLSNRLRSIVLQHPEYRLTDTAQALKSRNITRTRANRALLHTILGLTGKYAYPQAVHLLGLRRGTKVMRYLMDQTDIPVISRMADAPEGIFEEDVFAGRLYNRLVFDHTGLLLKDDYRQGPVLY